MDRGETITGFWRKKIIPYITDKRLPRRIGQTCYGASTEEETAFGGTSETIAEPFEVSVGYVLGERWEGGRWYSPGVVYFWEGR